MTRTLSALILVALWLCIVGYAAHVLSENVALAMDNAANQIAKS